MSFDANFAVHHALPLCEASYGATLPDGWVEVAPIVLGSSLDDPYLFRLIPSEAKGSKFGFLAESDTHVAIVFRGTTNPVEWANDIFCRLDKDGVGSGFDIIYQALHESLDALNIPAGKEILITGHSLGGALALLHSVRFLVRKPPQSHTVITFAAPRTLSHAEAQEYEQYMAQQGILSYRVVNHLDVIPHQPSELLGYRHAGTAVDVSPGIPWHMMSPLMQFFSYEHSLNAYRIGLEDTFVEIEKGPK